MLSMIMRTRFSSRGAYILNGVALDNCAATHQDAKAICETRLSPVSHVKRALLYRLANLVWLNVFAAFENSCGVETLS